MKRVFQPSWIWGMRMTRMRIMRMRMRMSSNFVTTYCLICFFSFENKLKSWNPTIPSPIFSWERWVIQHFFAQRTTGWATSGGARSENGNPNNERMSVSDPWEKIEWGADSEPRINERVPSSGWYTYILVNYNVTPFLCFSYAVPWKLCHDQKDQSWFSWITLIFPK